MGERESERGRTDTGTAPDQLGRFGEGRRSWRERSECRRSRTDAGTAPDQLGRFGEGRPYFPEL
ncbi:hypothetical protein MINS_00570 [Mycolicibacterium insubricum]|nr:hypothetical protein MINS_00570 [Mycolicibacterium insubricum]